MDAEPATTDRAAASGIRVTVDEAGMVARVVLDLEAERPRPSSDEIFDAMRAAGVVFGIDEAAVRQGSQGHGCAEFIAARGRPAQPGTDVCFVLQVSASRDRAARQHESGVVDLRDFGDVPVVAPGQALMRRIPPAAGVDGCTVRGELLPAKAGRDEPFKTPFEGAELDPADRDLLRATLKGQPVRTGNAVMVEQVFRVKRVDMLSGHITFDGTVQVDGDVLSGMKVHAGGDIVVGGTVEGAELEAAGDIRIAGGAIARARLDARGTVAARFVENAAVQAGQAILVDDTALHSELQAGTQIIVGTSARQRGCLAGGRAQARERISVHRLGGASAGCTHVGAGADPVLEQRLAELQEQVGQAHDQLSKLEQLAQALQHQGDPKGLLPRVQAALQQAQSACRASEHDKRDVEQQLAALHQARVSVSAALEGDVELRLGHRLCRPRESQGAVTFALDQDGAIVHIDAHGVAAPCAGH
ncbi:DUF342 domain-containing protein [Aquabacterium humicola]|uniref:DUF342 domain-containing protein n=1 Tax=Aquabacterium humicola TaxID=3237377 RepID=UPI002542CF13|nr:FapA family protein [Rubrivivax pictus]